MVEECRPGWCECLPRPGVWRLAGGWPALGPPPPPPRPGPAHTSSGLQTRGCVASVTHSVLTVCGVCVCVCECGGCSPVSVCRLCAGRCTSLAWLGWAGLGWLGWAAGLGGWAGWAGGAATAVCWLAGAVPATSPACCWLLLACDHGGSVSQRQSSARQPSAPPPWQHAAKHTPATSQ